MSKLSRFLPMAVTAAAVITAGSAAALTSSQPVAEKPAMTRLEQIKRSPYSDCVRQAMATCRAQYPNNLALANACIDAQVDGFCSTLPGAP